MSTAQHESETPPSNEQYRSKVEIWLDLLPHDVCAQIASILPLVEQREDDRVSTDQIEEVPPMFPLAAASETQRSAVASIHAGVVRIDRVNDCYHAASLIRLWQSVLLTDIKEVHLPINVGVGPEVCQLLSMPTVTKAVAPNSPSLMRALLSQCSVKVLDLQVTSYVPFRGQDGLVMLSQVLKSCPIEELSLTCHGCGGHDHRNNRTCQSLATLFGIDSRDTPSALRSLRISCSSRRLGPLFLILAKYPTLDEFCWECTYPPTTTGIAGFLRVPRMWRHHLNSLKSIHLIHCGPLYAFASEYGEKIASFSSRQKYGMAQLKLLKRCPRIASIELFLREGAEAFFPTSLTTLRSISLSWNGQLRSQEEGYYEPQSETLAAFIRRNKQVQELRFKNVKLSLSLLSEILSDVGARLKVLQLPICLQGDSPIDRIPQVIRLTIKHNPNLSELCFDASELNDFAETSLGSIQIRHIHQNPRHSEECVYCELRDLIDVWWPILKRWQPGIREDSPEELKDRLKPCFRQD